MKKEAVVFLLALVVLLRLPSLFEPYWYGDEGIYLTIGQAVQSGMRLYTDIVDYPSKPPLIYLVATIARGNLFWFKFIGLVWVVTTVAIFWLVAEKWFAGSKKLVLTASLGFALLVNWPMLEGNIVNAELFFILPNLVAMYLVLVNSSRGWRVCLAGAAIGIATLFKIQAGLELAIWPIVWFWQRDRRLLAKLAQLGTGWLAVIGLSVLWMATQGAGREYVWAVTGGNWGYVNLRYALVLAGVAALALAGVAGARKYVGKTGTLWCVWTVTATTAVLVSNRPYPHYLIQLIPVVALGIGMAVSGGKAQRTAVVLSLAGIVGIWLAGKYYRYPSLGYYANFIGWVTGQKSDRDYLAWFGNQVTQTYSLARVISASSTAYETVYVWGDDASVYPLAKRLPAFRYIVKFHIDGTGQWESLAASLEKKPPRYIVVDEQEEEFERLARLIQSRYVLERKAGESRLYRRMGYAL